VRILAAALSLAALAGIAEARSLHWRNFEVEARLEESGRLRVIERQAMVFTGDWNGGERSFRVPAGQGIDLHGVRRIDGPMGSVDLQRGDLDEVDHYDWHSGHTLRWRSRAAGDPLFDDSVLVYEIEYSLFGVLQEESGTYWLDHDFAFPDRAGRIERFALELTLDGAWEALPIPRVERRTLPNGELVTLERENLPPGESVVLHFGLHRLAAEPPADVRHTLSKGARLAIAITALFAMALLLSSFFHHERKQRRYSDLGLPESLLDPSWLNEHLLSMRPEVAGAVWDQRIGPSEVAAVLARLISEKRLASTIEERGRWFKRKVLFLDLLVERGSFEDYERRLIDKLFFDRRLQTDTDAVKKRYRSTGFSPTGTIRAGIKRRVKKLRGFSSRLPKRSVAVSMLLFFAGLVSIGLETLIRGFSGSGPALGLILVASVPPLVLSYAFASGYNRRSEHLPLWLTLLLAPFVFAAGLLLWAIVAGRRFPLAGIENIGLFGCLALVLFLLCLLNSVLNLARTRDRQSAVETRRRLSATRQVFKREIRRSEPALDDEWLPYLLAFGLEREVDRWFRAFGALGGAVRSQTFSPNRTSSSSGGGGWSGGGGAFGGAGASASWAAVATTMASGVSRPGSSGGGGSSSGGGGGGGSSGGGGGGGW
jgi:hypothetical protein